MYTMPDICLLVYFLPNVSRCGFIRYLIKYKFATNNDSVPRNANFCSGSHIAKSKYRKQLAIFYKFKIKNKSALYRIQINNVTLGLWTYPQIARHRLWLCSHGASILTAHALSHRVIYVGFTTLSCPKTQLKRILSETFVKWCRMTFRTRTHHKIW